MTSYRFPVRTGCLSSMAYAHKQNTSTVSNSPLLGSGSSPSNAPSIPSIQEKLPRVCGMSRHPAVDKSRPKCLLTPHPPNRTAPAWYCDFFISKYQSRVYIISFKYRSGNINNVVSELLKQLKGLTRIDIFHDSQLSVCFLCIP